MIASRVSDGHRLAVLIHHARRLRTTIAHLEAEIASGRRVITPDDDPLATADVVRLRAALAEIGRGASTDRFAADVLDAQADALAAAGELMARAREIAEEASSPMYPEAREALRQEVRGLLEALTAVANGELAGRRLFGGLALDAPPPFLPPPEDLSTYDPNLAYVGPGDELWVGTGAGRLRLGREGVKIFGSSLRALRDLALALDAGVDVAATRDALEEARAHLDGERAAVETRAAAVLDAAARADDEAGRTRAMLARVRDADLSALAAQLTAVRAALEATLALAAQTTRPMLTILRGL